MTATINEFLRLIKAAFPELRADLEPSPTPSGSWWIDLRGREWGFPVSWRADLGFGFYTDPDVGFGERPSETYSDAQLAARRAATLVREAELGRAPKPMGLAELRELRQVTQSALAERLHKSQAAVSKLEARNEVQIGTLRETVMALGGHLEICVRFDNMEANITCFGDRPKQR